MRTIKQIQADIDAAEDELHAVQLRIQRLTAELHTAERGYGVGDIIEYAERGKVVRGLVTNMSQYVPIIQLYKSNGFLGLATRNVYDHDNTAKVVGKAAP